MAASGLILALLDMDALTARNTTVESLGKVVYDDIVTQWRAIVNEAARKFMDYVYDMNAIDNRAPVRQYNMPYDVRFQIVTEDGVADPIMAGLNYEIGAPLLRGEIAHGMTWESSLVMTVEEWDKRASDIMSADRNLLVDIAKRAIFYNLPYTFYSVEEDRRYAPATITVPPLANGDSQKYLLKTGAVVTANHYIATPTQVSDANDLLASGYALLSRYATASPNPNIVAFVNGAALITAIEGLTQFYPYADSTYINYGSGITTLDNSIANQLFFGDKVLGRHTAGVTVVHWESMPEGYIAMFDMNQKPLGLREKPEETLQGLLVQEAYTNNGREKTTYYRRHVGAAVVNRIAGLVYFPNASDTTYDVPTGMTPKG